MVLMSLNGSKQLHILMIMMNFLHMKQGRKTSDTQLSRIPYLKIYFVKSDLLS